MDIIENIMMNPDMPDVSNEPLTVLNDERIRNALDLWRTDRAKADEVYGPIEEWDTRFVVDMSKLFRGDAGFNENIGKWDVGNVRNFSFMFSNTLSFNADISEWNVSRARNMTGMFSGAVAFNQDISKWSVSNVVNFAAMFHKCK